MTEVTESRPIRILVVDDHRLVWEGIRAIVNAQRTMEVIGGAADGEEGVQMALRLEPDVVLMDISMPIMNGLDATAAILAANPRIKIIMVTMHFDPHLAAEAVRAGASGYVLKHSAGDELIQAVCEVFAGQIYITPVIARDLMVSLATVSNSDAGLRLTVRQRQVLQLVAEGHTMEQVAALLGVSRRTAEAHKHRIMELLDVQSAAELVQRAIRMGFHRS